MHMQADKVTVALLERVICLANLAAYVKIPIKTENVLT